MNVAGRTPLSSTRAISSLSPLGEQQTGMDVDMYLEAPSFELSLDDFEEYALARLKVRHHCIRCGFILFLPLILFESLRK